jgi:hypothetical protein
MSRGVVGVLAALGPNTYYRRIHIAKTIVVDAGGGGGSGGGDELQDKEYAVDAVVYSATTGLPLHVALTYAAREDMSDGTPVFDDHHCPSVVFYVGGTATTPHAPHAPHRTHRDTHPRVSCAHTRTHTHTQFTRARRWCGRRTWRARRRWRTRSTCCGG